MNSLLQHYRSLIASRNLLDSLDVANSQFSTIVSKGNGGCVATSLNSISRTSVVRLFEGVLPAGVYEFSCNMATENSKGTSRDNEVMVFVEGKFFTYYTGANAGDGTYSPTLKFHLLTKQNVSIRYYFSVIDNQTVSDTVAKVTFSNLWLGILPIQNIIDCKLWSTPTTQNGVTVQYLEDEDCFLFNGTFTTYANLAAKTMNVPVNSGTLTTVTKYVSGTVTIPSGRYAVMYIDGVNKHNYYDTKNFKTNDTISNGSNMAAATINQARFYISTGVVFDNYKVRIAFYSNY